METAEQIEKRIHRRAHFSGAVSLREISRSHNSDYFSILGMPIIGMGRDISEGGMCLNLPDDKPLPPVLKLNFRLQRELPLEIYTRLAWQVHALCGVEFIMKDDDLTLHLRSYVHRYSS